MDSERPTPSERGYAAKVNRARALREQIACPECGRATTVSHLTGEIAAHTREFTFTPCPASRRVVLAESERASTPKEAHEREVGSRVTVTKIECDGCGQTVKLNLRTGRLYSHNLPNSAEICPVGNTVVRAPDPSLGGLPEGVLTPKSPPPEPPTKQARVPREERSESIRALGGGLPTLGRRRR